MDTPGVPSDLPQMIGKEEAVPVPVSSSASVPSAGDTPRLGSGNTGARGQGSTTLGQHQDWTDLPILVGTLRGWAPVRGRTEL